MKMDTSDILVTVCVPCFNCRRYLDKAVDSVFGQSHANWELIIVDDGSTDGSAELIRGFQVRDPVRVKPLLLARNMGVAHARNQAIAKARGAYIALLDADDCMRPPRLETQLRHLEQNPELAAVFSLIDYIDQDGNKAFPREELFSPRTSQLRRHLLKGNCLNAPSAMMRTKPLKDVGLFNPGIRTVEDYDLWMRILEHYEIALLPERLTEYRIHGENVSAIDKPRSQHLANRYETAIIKIRATLRWPLDKLFDFRHASGSPGRLEEEGAAYRQLSRYCINLDKNYFGRPFLGLTAAYTHALEASKCQPGHPDNVALLNEIYCLIGDQSGAEHGPRHSIVLQEWQRTDLLMTAFERCGRKP